LLGTPPDEEIENIPKSKARDYMRSLGKKKPTPFSALFPGVNPQALDLLQNLLQFDPSKRFNSWQAIEHEYFADLHCDEDEPVRLHVCKFDFEFERRILTASDLKDLIYEEILLYHFPEV